MSTRLSTLGLLALLAPAGIAQVSVASYTLDNVWLLPDITHPWESAQQMTGRFEWSYTPGDFDNGSGQFLSMYIPWYGSDHQGLNINVDLNTIEFVLPGNFHDTGLDLTLRLLQDLTPDGTAVVDNVNSLFDIEQVGISRKGHVISGSIVPDSDFNLFCFGDGSGTACPCANTGDVGAGCENSVSGGGRLTPGGSSSVAADDLGFDATSIPANQPALLYSGTLQLSGGAGVPFGGGLRCAGGATQRLGIQTADALGNAHWGPGLASSFGFASGDTRYFQLWYRDPADLCGTGFNLTNAVAVVFAP